MKNIVKVNKKQVWRIYDIKGSTYDRQVLKQCSSILANDRIAGVLKDKDFLELENSMGLP